MAKAAPAVHVHTPLPRPVLELAVALAHATGRDVIALEADAFGLPRWSQRQVDAINTGWDKGLEWPEDRTETTFADSHLARVLQRGYELVLL